MEQNVLRPPSELELRMAETEAQVLALVAELADSENTLSQAFYSDLGISPTPLVEVNRPMAGHVALLKDETRHSLAMDGQVFESGSFKRRGALLAALVACNGEDPPDTFVTASQGNHAIAVVMAARSLGRQASIYCPGNLNDVKRQKLEDLGAKIYTEGITTFEEALLAASEAAEDPSAQMIHPFDSVEVIAGQATVGLEIVRDLEARAARGELDLHTTPIEVNAAVGGGGFITGMAIVLKYFRDKGVIGDNVRLVGAQMEGCDAARRSVEDIRRGGGGTARFADGEFNPVCDSTAVTSVGELTLPFMADRRYVQGFRLITPAYLGANMRMLTGVYHRTIEPAGSLALASARLGASEHGQPHAWGEEPTVYVVPVCGANTTWETYRQFQDYDQAEYEARMALLTEMHRLGNTAVREHLRSPSPSVKNANRVWSGPTAGLHRVS